jgi:hypothetical protein
MRASVRSEIDSVGSRITESTDTREHERRSDMSASLGKEMLFAIGAGLMSFFPSVLVRFQ